MELWSISSQVFDNFSAATDSTFITRRLSELEYLSDTYERWRQEWTAMLETQLQVEPALPAILDLYFHSARLYLSSHIFKRPEQGFVRPEDTPNPLDRWAHSATQSALSIVYRMTVTLWSGLARFACPVPSAFTFEDVCWVSDLSWSILKTTVYLPVVVAGAEGGLELVPFGIWLTSLFDRLPTHGCFFIR